MLLHQGRVSRKQQTQVGSLRRPVDLTPSFETLVGSLHLLGMQRPMNTLLITSTQPNEGKTTITVNLATQLTQSGKRVLIVDGDLRKPRIDQMLALRNSPGLSDVLTGQVALPEAVQLVELSPQAKGSVSALTSGRRSPDALATLNSPLLKKTLDDVREDFDMILVDSAPVLAVSDPLMLAPHTDGVILVLSSGVITEQDAKRAKRRIEHSGGEVVGLVMNRFDERRHGPSFHPYQDHYRVGQQ